MGEPDVVKRVFDALVGDAEALTRFWEPINRAVSAAGARESFTDENRAQLLEMFAINMRESKTSFMPGPFEGA